MAPGNQAGGPRWGPRLLAGIEAGVLGGVVTIAATAAACAMSRQSVWTAPNLFASLFIGPSALGRTFHSATMSGLALQVCAAGLLGLMFGVFAGGTRSRLRMLLLGILTALIWYYLSQTLLLRKLGVLALMYAAPKPLLFGNVCFGFVLGLYPGFLNAAESKVREFAGAPERAALQPAEGASLQSSAPGAEPAGSSQPAAPETGPAGPPEEIGRM
jgi:hypothetical protein